MRAEPLTHALDFTDKIYHIVYIYTNFPTTNLTFKKIEILPAAAEFIFARR